MRRATATVRMRSSNGGSGVSRTGMRVRQERRLRERERAHRTEIAERRAMAVTAQELAMGGKQRLRLVAEREQRFLRAEPRAGLCERDDFLGRHRVCAGFARIAA